MPPEQNPSSSEPELGLDLSFLSALWTLDHELQRASKGMLQSLGVTGPQRLALRLVGRFPGLTAGRLAALLHLHASTVSGILKRLESRGLLQRAQDPADRRRARLVLTAAGLELVAGPHPTIEGAVREMIRALSPEEVARARHSLLDLSERLSRLRTKVSPADGSATPSTGAQPRRPQR